MQASCAITSSALFAGGRCAGLSSACGGGAGVLGNFHRHLGSAEVLEVGHHRPQLDFREPDAAGRRIRHRAFRVSRARLAEAGDDERRRLHQRLVQVGLGILRAALVARVLQPRRRLGGGALQRGRAPPHRVVAERAGALALDEPLAERDELLEAQRAAGQRLLLRRRRGLDLRHAEVGEAGEERDHQHAEADHLEEVDHCAAAAFQ
ncbi:MAG: hypothetical protein M5U08_02800 [Burkholderiales bacterium]|nr:hypothetical protein [Burkholderiales bacterium]